MAGRSCNQVVDSTIHVSAEDQLNLSNTLTMCFHTMLSINAILCLFFTYLLLFSCSCSRLRGPKLPKSQEETEWDGVNFDIEDGTHEEDPLLPHRLVHSLGRAQCIVITRSEQDVFITC